MRHIFFLMRIVCPFAAIFVTVSCNFTFAQELESQREKTQTELEAIRSQISLSQARRAELADEIDRLEKDRASINRNLIDTSARQRNIETRIDRTGNRLEELRTEQASVKLSLGDRRGLLSEVLAALQRMGRKPPPAILVTPGDALSAVRSAILLGAVVPEIRAETEVLVAELGEMNRIENDIEIQRSSLSQDLREQAEEEERLTRLLTEKKSLTNSARQELAEQGARAAELAAKAGNLGKLIETLESEISSVRQAADAARRAEEHRLSEEEKRLVVVPGGVDMPDFSDTSRIAPAVEFE
jgi:septal ring factor EnvC (AmiA/AmiB activator)